MTTYKTQEGDRWDTISFRIWGHCLGMPALWEANQALLKELNYPDILPGGIDIQVPDTQSAEISTDTLPPWKESL